MDFIESRSEGIRFLEQSFLLWGAFRSRTLGLGFRLFHRHPFSRSDHTKSSYISEDPPKTAVFIGHGRNLSNALHSSNL
jgi:hypothetical protein